jgi:hypothetical protein
MPSPGQAPASGHQRKRLIPATTPGKIVAAVAGTAGTGSAGLSIAALSRTGFSHAASGTWAGPAALAAVTVLVACLGLILEYRLHKLEAGHRHQEAQRALDLQKHQDDIYRVVMEKAAGEPANAPSYRDLLIAGALYLSVERNGTQPTDKAHGRLYGPAGTSPGSDTA